MTVTGPPTTPSRVSMHRPSRGTPTTDAIEVHDELVDDEVLVKEISIDGMCGVY